MMKRIVPAVLLLTLFVLGSQVRGQESEETPARLAAAFEQYSGARLVFNVKDLPPGVYHDVMDPLPEEGRLKAARIVLREVRKLPPGYLGAVGLKAIGVFRTCVSEYDDGFRPYDKELKGYRYYGIWNGKDAVAAAYYRDGQLPLTFHHEIFHHVDATRHGKTGSGKLSEDDAFRDALSGKAPYSAAKIAPDDLAALKKRGRGRVLESAVSEYAKKNAAEDKAETARYLLTNLPDALVQAATRPELPGSQRLLHVLHRYEQAPAGNGPGIGWFVDVALDRVNRTPAGNPVQGTRSRPDQGHGM
jgi:hypothetical protein